jgi:hypothetical protein
MKTVDNSTSYQDLLGSYKQHGNTAGGIDLEMKENREPRIRYT